MVEPQAKHKSEVDEEAHAIETRASQINQRGPRPEDGSMNNYPAAWTDGSIPKAVKDAAGWRCVRCNHPHSRDGWRILTVHHLDGDKSNVEWWNLAALCQRCHLHIQGKVVMSRTWMFPHSEWFRPYVAGYYAHHYGRPTDREYVEANMDELIAIGQGRVAA